MANNYRTSLLLKDQEQFIALNRLAENIGIDGSKRFGKKQNRVSALIRALAEFAISATPQEIGAFRSIISKK